MPTCPRAPCCGGFEAAKKPEMQPLIQEVEREVGASAIGACQHSVSISSSKKDLQPKNYWRDDLQMPWKIKTVPLFRQSPRSRENDQSWNWSMNHGRPNMTQDISWFSSSAAFRCYWNSSKRQSCFAARSNWRTEWNMKRPQWLMVIQSVWAEERRGMPLSTDLFPEPPKLQFKWPNRPIPPNHHSGSLQDAEQAFEDARQHLSHGCMMCW